MCSTGNANTDCNRSVRSHRCRHHTDLGSKALHSRCRVGRISIPRPEPSPNPEGEAGGRIDQRRGGRTTHRVTPGRRECVRCAEPHQTRNTHPPECRPGTEQRIRSGGLFTKTPTFFVFFLLCVLRYSAGVVDPIGAGRTRSQSLQRITSQAANLASAETVFPVGAPCWPE